MSAAILETAILNIQEHPENGVQPAKRTKEGHELELNLQNDPTSARQQQIQGLHRFSPTSGPVPG